MLFGASSQNCRMHVHITMVDLPSVCASKAYLVSLLCFGFLRDNILVVTPHPTPHLVHYRAYTTYELILFIQSQSAGHHDDSFLCYLGMKI